MEPTDLQKWRIKHGHTQVSLAQQLRVSSNTIARWERGERQIPPFLYLALGYLELEGGEQAEGKKLKKKKKKGE